MIGVVLAALFGATPVIVPACGYDRAVMLALSPAKFDQDMHGGWRPLAAKPACLLAAADLLAAYRKVHWGNLQPGELHMSYWHEGQLRALMGQNKPAVPLLLAGVNPDVIDDSEDYALGTVAFLNHDLEALRAARDRMSALPKAAWFDRSAAEVHAHYGFTPRWPPNIDVLDGLIDCFEKPYAQAYDFKCRPKAPAS